MHSDIVTLAGDSPGAERRITCLRYGRTGARPKAYLQAGLHADEMPGVLVLQHLLPLLDAAEAEGRIAGEVLVVPVANPIGLGQWLQHKPLGRQDLESMQNFNRNYPDLAALVGDDLDSVLTGSEAENLHLVRAAFGAALDRAEAKTDLAEQRLCLLRWSHDADHVLDLHCDHHAVLHLYASPARPEDTSLLCRCVGAELALIQEVSGGNAFDEALTAPWAALKRRYEGRFPIPSGCFSATLEYRGQFDVDDDLAGRDAANLMAYLAGIGAVRAEDATAQYPEPPYYPLGGAVEAFAPVGGVVTWTAAPGDRVEKGQSVAHVTDPVARRRHPIPAPVTGMLFRIELWRSCLRGQGLCHVAGPEIVAEGHLLSD
ncbi:MAG: M14 family metallopeptidase [Paracoccaceae bacterium]